MGTTTHFDEVARDIRMAQSRAAALLGEIRLAAKYLKTEHGYSLEMLAEITKLHRNSVMKLNNDEEWTPTPETLGQLSVLLTEADRKRAGLPGSIDPPKRGRPPAAKEAAPSPRKKNGSSPRKKPARATGASKAKAS